MFATLARFSVPAINHKQKNKTLFMNTNQSNELTSFITMAEEFGHETILAETEMFNHWDVNSLIELLIRHYHCDARKNITGIYDLAQKVSVNHSHRHSELSKLTAALFLFFDDLLFHLKIEEQILFPDIKHLVKKTSASKPPACHISKPVRDLAFIMQKEHQAAIKELMFLRKLTNNYMIPADACRFYNQLFQRMKEFEKELLLHIHLENNILFPKVIQMDEIFTGKEMKIKI